MLPLSTIKTETGCLLILKSFYSSLKKKSEQIDNFQGGK